jgi:hypothetical protein
MRRILLLAVGVLTLALAVPVAASAHGRHHRHHHRHAAHHARARHFGAAANTNPTDPGTPDAGTVTSFENGVLTITLGDGSVVRGGVTGDTVINCIPAGGTAASHDGGDDRRGDDQGDDRGDQQGDDDDQGDDDGGQASCDTTDLVAGSVVHEAILRIGAGGAQFKLVLLDQWQGA